MSGLDPWGALVVSVALIALSAFFVAVEFALVAARRYRLEAAAPRSTSARAALRSARELTLLLAGSQLGITLCVIGLGAVSKPAVHHALLPLFDAAGMPGDVAYVVAFVLSLIVVTFVHLVVGEMAPKSWAIAHPERSATMLAWPMRAFIRATRPVLIALNGAANRCLRLVGVRPVDEVTARYTPDDLRELVDHSARAGALDARRRDQLASALEVNARPLSDVMTPHERFAAIPAEAGPTAIRAEARRTGHLRLVVYEGASPAGVLHVRDAMAAAQGTTAADLMHPALALAAGTPMYAGLNIMRESRSHLALVEDDDHPVGLVTLQDLVDRLLHTTHDGPTGHPVSH